MKYVNCIAEECTHYCGRKSSIGRAKGKPIDLSILSNPIYLHDESKRDDVIKQYASHLVELCNSNEYILPILQLIPHDAVLGCFCYPKDCHCRIIIEACNSIRNR